MELDLRDLNIKNEYNGMERNKEWWGEDEHTCGRASMMVAVTISTSSIPDYRAIMYFEINFDF
jgi:hypothetical protein